MKKVAIIGSSGAIGNAISKQLIEDKDIELIYRFSRTKNEISSDPGTKRDTVQAV